MKTFATVPLAVAPSRTIRESGAVRYRLASKRSLLRRFQHFIVSTDWEERYLCNHWLDKMCIVGIGVSLIYFLPLLMFMIQE
jgi:hypothetical protein